MSLFAKLLLMQLQELFAGNKVTASWLINAAVTDAATRSLHWINR